MLILSPATIEHAPALACLINLAGEGIPAYLWSALTEGGESAMDVGARRAAREEGSFSYRNAMICTENGILAGMILAYRQADLYDSGDISECPAIVRPLVELESRAPGSWYINAIATFETHRGKGVATRLLLDTEQRARASACAAMSLIVASGNTDAKRLYASLGFTIRDARPIIPWPGCTHDGDWLLMIRDLTS